MRMVATLFLQMFVMSVIILGAATGNNHRGDTREIEHSRLLSAAFFGTNFAWLVTQFGRDLLITQDGGEQWYTVSGGVVNGFGQISFIDNFQGWAIGSTGTVWKTTDGGRHWKSIARLRSHNDKGFFGRQAQFVDRLHGWVIETPHYLWQTRNGGKSWEVYSPLNEGTQVDLIRLHFINSRIGWLGCDKGTLLQTGNGGHNWQALKRSGSAPFYDLLFLSSQTGWALIGNSIYRSFDSGQNWEPVFRNEEAFESPIILSFHFLNEQNGWAVGHSNAWAEKVTVPSEIRGVIFHTNDGGNTWSEVKTNLRDKTFSQIHLADQQHGWLISPDNVYRTNDGGQSWRPVLKIPSAQR